MISGAINNPNSDNALRHAYLYYEEIRHNHSDVKKIAENTGFTDEQILMIKHFLFIDEHNLNGEIKRFEPSFEIAQSWQRLFLDKDNIKPHDIILLKHELLEMKLMQEGLSQSEAHIKASELYDYSKESNKYYDSLNIQITHNKQANCGAISFEDYSMMRY